MHLCSNPPIKWQTLPRMKYVLCSVRKRQYKQHDGEKMAMWNSAHSRFIKLWKSNTNTTEKFIKHVLPAKVRAINRQRPCKARARPTQARISFWVKVLHNRYYIECDKVADCINGSDQSCSAVPMLCRPCKQQHHNLWHIPLPNRL